MEGIRVNDPLDGIQGQRQGFFFNNNLRNFDIIVTVNKKPVVLTLNINKCIL